MKNILLSEANTELGLEFLNQALSISTYKTAFNIRAGVHSTELLPLLKPEPSEVVVFDYYEESTWVKSLEGMDSIVLILNESIPTHGPVLTNFINFINEKHPKLELILLSKSYAPHLPNTLLFGACEKALTEGENPYTILRSNSTIEDFIQLYGPSLKKIKTLSLPVDKATISLHSRKSFIEATLASLIKPCKQKTFNITGSNSISFSKLIKLLGQKSKQELEYKYMNAEDWIKEGVQKGMPESTCRYLATLFTLLDRGTESEPSNDYFELTSQKSQPIEFYLKSMSQKIFK